MSQYLVNPSRGLVLGAATQNSQGKWRFTPFTTAHQASRKDHQTKEAAALRYCSPSCRWVEAENSKAAHGQAMLLKSTYDAWEPCSKCALAAKITKDSFHCCAGAAPYLARNLGRCAKFMSEKEAQAQHEKMLVEMPVTEAELTGVPEEV